MERSTCCEIRRNHHWNSVRNNDSVIIDKQLHKVAITAVVGYVLACFGFIHSAGLGFNPASPFAIGYLIVAVLAIILHQGRKSWFEGPDDFDYV